MDSNQRGGGRSEWGREGERLSRSIKNTCAKPKRDSIEGRREMETTVLEQQQQGDPDVLSSSDLKDRKKGKQLVILFSL